MAAIFLLVIEVNMIVIYTYTMVDDVKDGNEGVGKEEVTRVKRIDRPGIKPYLGPDLENPNSEPESDPDMEPDLDPDTELELELDLNSSNDNNSNDTNTATNSENDLGSGEVARERNETEVPSQHKQSTESKNTPGLATGTPLGVWLPAEKNNHSNKAPVTDIPVPSTPKPQTGKEKGNLSPQHVPIHSPPLAPKDSKLPNAIVIGSMCSGSTMLLDILKFHPQVVVSNTTRFFDKYGLYKQGVAWYTSHLPEKKSGQVLIEEAVDMFSNANCPVRLKKVDPNMRLIVLLRNPLERSFMDYQTHEGKGVAKSGYAFRQSIVNEHDRISTTNTFIKRSLYDVHLTNWFKNFNITQFLFIDYSQLLLRPFATLSRVEKFLEIQGFFHKYSFVYNKDQMVCLNKKYFKIKLDKPKCLADEMALPSNATVSRALEVRLRDFFAPHMEKTLKLVSGSLEFEDMVSLVLT